MKLRILASRHSAFYSPLLATMSAGFLEREGVEYSYQVLQPGESAYAMVMAREVDIAQSAISSSFGATAPPLSLPIHFAQINIMDGFFLTARQPETFEWKNLEGKTILADHGRQPLAMLRYVAIMNGADWDQIRVVDAGTPERMIDAFRAGDGDYVHLQGPAPQLLEHQGVGAVLTAVGSHSFPVAFSSLCARRDFIKTEPYDAFMRAYLAAKEWVEGGPVAEVAAQVHSFFPDVPIEVLERTMESYQKLGCWQGSHYVPAVLFQQAMTVFRITGDDRTDLKYADICL